MEGGAGGHAGDRAGVGGLQAEADQLGFEQRRPRAARHCRGAREEWVAAARKQQHVRLQPISVEPQVGQRGGGFARPVGRGRRALLLELSDGARFGLRLGLGRFGRRQLQLALPRLPLLLLLPPRRRFGQLRGRRGEEMGVLKYF